MSPEAWLQFDDKNQEFVGIPLEEEVGREEYQLVCSDANGLSAIGKRHALKKYNQFALNTSCFFGNLCKFTKFLVQKKLNKLLYYYC